MPTDIPAGPSAYPAGRADPTFRPQTGATESAVSGVSWGAIVAGGIAAAAMAMILAILGAGLGLVSISPWPGRGASAGTFGAGVVIWSIIIEILAFGIGGYLAGRLRTKWANLHGDEVYFRDTAHGLITWALGTLVGVALVASAAGHVARGGAEVGAAAASGIAAGGAGAGLMAMNDTGPRGAQGGPMGGPMGGPGMRGNPVDYYIDMLFRPAGPMPAATTTGATTGTTTGTTTDNGTAAAPPPAAPAPEAAGAGPRPDLGPVRAEIGRIVMNSIKDGQVSLSQTDHAYIGSLIAQRTGLSQQDAEKRLDDVIGQAKAAMDDLANKAKQAADDARKAGAALALWTFVSMLIGAFVASFAATIGGRHRDL
ncbi:MAG TPA: hypothetical protein VHE77_17555 [Dongiaceae bacterium]|nr:hypothetical protein [Dongiaceae bacterium]